MKKFRVLFASIGALLSFVCMFLPSVSETFIRTHGTNMSAIWSALFFSTFILLCSVVSESFRKHT